MKDHISHLWLIEMKKQSMFSYSGYSSDKFNGNSTSKLRSDQLKPSDGSLRAPILNQLTYCDPPFLPVSPQQLQWN